MIPKIIHYCWFSGEKFPPIIKDCIKSWEKNLSDYTIIEWNAKNTIFDTPFAKKTFNEKKWAFLTDYIRMKILYEHGGIFLDTDVLVLKPFDNLLTYESFWNFAINNMIEPVVIGAKKNNALIKICKEYYESIDENELKNYQYVEIPKIITPLFKQHGFLLNNTTQIINNNIVLEHTAFCSLPFEEADKSNPLRFITEKTFAVHLWNANWFDDEFRFFWNNRWKKGWKLALKKILLNPFRGIQYYKSLFYHFKRQFFKKIFN